MRTFVFVSFLVSTMSGNFGCGSSAGNPDGGGGGTTGSAGTTGSGGSSASDGGQMCSPACGSGSICVASGSEGGAVIFPNDAGVCPSGRHLSGSVCVNDLAYSCAAIPAGCGGNVTCTCASSLCPTSFMCQGPSNGVLSCIQAVP
jgi:hypothetical protein